MPPKPQALKAKPCIPRPPAPAPAPPPPPASEGPKAPLPLKPDYSKAGLDQYLLPLKGALVSGGCLSTLHLDSHAGVCVCGAGPSVLQTCRTICTCPMLTLQERLLGAPTASRIPAFPDALPAGRPLTAAGLPRSKLKPCNCSCPEGCAPQGRAFSLLPTCLQESNRQSYCSEGQAC